MVRWLCVLHLSLTVALVPPVARLSRHVLCSGAAYDYCVQSLGCTAEEAAKAEGKLLPRSAESRTREKIDYVCNWLQSELGLSDAELKKMVMRFPSVLGYNKASVEPKLDWLQKRLDLDVGQLRKILLRMPPVLGSSVEDNLAPTLEWLQTRLDLDEPGLRKMVLRFPSLLSMSVEDNMAPKLAYLEREIGLSRSELRDWVVKNPTLLGYSLANRYRPRIEAGRVAGVV